MLLLTQPYPRPLREDEPSQYPRFAAYTRNWTLANYNVIAYILCKMLVCVRMHTPGRTDKLDAAIFDVICFLQHLHRIDVLAIGGIGIGNPMRMWKNEYTRHPILSAFYHTFLPAVPDFPPCEGWAITSMTKEFLGQIAKYMVLLIYKNPQHVVFHNSLVLACMSISEYHPSFRCFETSVRKAERECFEDLPHRLMDVMVDDDVMVVDESEEVSQGELWYLSEIYLMLLLVLGDSIPLMFREEFNRYIEALSVCDIHYRVEHDIPYHRNVYDEIQSSIDSLLDGRRRREDDVTTVFERFQQAVAFEVDSNSSSTCSVCDSDVDTEVGEYAEGGDSDTTYTR